MTGNLYFKHLSSPFHRVPVHNITLLDIQPADGGTATLTVEYQGTQTVLLGNHWSEAYRSHVGQRGEWEDLFCTYANRSDNAEQLLDVISTLVDKLENAGPEVLLERLRTLTRDE